MAGSMSPNPPAFGGQAAQDKSPLSTLNLGFLKNLTEKRTTRGTPFFEELESVPFLDYSQTFVTGRGEGDLS